MVDYTKNQESTPMLRKFLLVLVPAALFNIPTATRAQTLFFQPPNYPGIGQAVTADFNGDGKPDLASQDGTVVFGNGDGTFRAGTKLGVPNGLIVTADFNG